MDKTWTIRTEVKNGEGEILTNYKYVCVTDLHPQIVEANLELVAKRLFEDILVWAKEKKWL